MVTVSESDRYSDTDPDPRIRKLPNRNSGATVRVVTVTVTVTVKLPGRARRGGGGGSELGKLSANERSNSSPSLDREPESHGGFTFYGNCHCSAGLLPRHYSGY
jgi:hypothetical protein